MLKIFVQFIRCANGDETDQKNFRHATAEAIRIHEAAGAQEVLYGVGNKLLTWKRGQNLEDYIQTIMKQPLLDGAQAMISAHQLCSCRMGTNPAERFRATAVPKMNPRDSAPATH